MKRPTKRRLVVGREIVKILGTELQHAGVRGGEDVQDRIQYNSFCDPCSNSCPTIERVPTID